MHDEYETLCQRIAQKIQLVRYDSVVGMDKWTNSDRSQTVIIESYGGSGHHSPVILFMGNTIDVDTHEDLGLHEAYRQIVAGYMKLNSIDSVSELKMQLAIEGF